MSRGMVFITVAALFLGMTGCDKQPESPGPRYGTQPPRHEQQLYRLAVHPLHNPAKLSLAYQPLIDHLNSQLRTARLELEASRDYAVFEAKISAHKPALLLPNPWQTLQAMQSGYHVIAMAGDPEDFRGIFVVRRDSDITVPGDLKGKSVSYPSPTALAACIMPQYFLHQHGINVNTQIRNRYVGSQESSIMNVYLGHTAAGATWPVPWRSFQKEHPREAAELKVAWETTHLINNSVMARNNLPPAVETQIRRLLLQLHTTAQGRSILHGMETARFRPANNTDYEVVRSYVARFEKEVRPVSAQ